MSKEAYLLAVVLSVFTGLATTAQVRARTVIYVDDDAPGDPTVSDLAEDGSAAHPFDAIQEGIDAAVDGDEVVVLDGTYTGTGNKDLDFGGKAITVRSENGPDNCIIDCEGSGRGFYFHNRETADSKVDGFTIQNGYAAKGGGVYCYYSSPTITNCTITGNTASSLGGGICCDYRSEPTIANCTITENTAYGHGGGIYCRESNSPAIANCTISGNMANSYGGGIFCCDGSNPTITNCTITGNTANQYGGSIGCWFSSSPTLTNCTITASTAGEDGGGIDCYYYSSPMITNCTISGNAANEIGGGFYCHSYSSPAITNCTITGNAASDYGGGINSYYYSSPAIANCILWGNTAAVGAQICGTTMVTYSDVQGGWAGVGNIDADPLFVNPGSEDYYLLPLSPCIDAGSNGVLPSDVADLNTNGDTAEPIPFDLDGNPRVIDGGWDLQAIVDMGAYEYQADCNDNGVYDRNDIAAGTSDDCNTNGFADECELEVNDCNNNGVPDECDLLGGHDCCDTMHGPGCSNPAIRDCVCAIDPYCCEVYWDRLCVEEMADEGCFNCQVDNDCNTNSIPDECEADTDSDGVIDECDPCPQDNPDDTDGDGVCDSDDICPGFDDGADEDGDGVPDGCDACPGGDDGVDCQPNGVPDACDISGGTSEDCQSSGIPDECELAAGTSEDCNTNGVLDECDINGGTSADANTNGIPDECEGCPYIYDLDGSCFVDAVDLGLFAACWLLSEGDAGWDENECADKDFDCSGTVDATDLGLFAGAWLKSDDQVDPADYPECRPCGAVGIICPGPEIVQVRSLAEHGPEGILGIIIGAFPYGDVEPRDERIHLIEVTFSQPMDEGSCENPAHLSIAGVYHPSPVVSTSAALAPDGLVLTITLTPALPDEDCYVFDLTGMLSAQSLPLADSTFAVAGLIGDMNGDSDVDSDDLYLFIPYMGTIPSEENGTVRFDCATDGWIDAGDLNCLLNHTSHSAPGCGD